MDNAAHTDLELEFLTQLARLLCNKTTKRQGADCVRILVSCKESWSR